MTTTRPTTGPNWADTLVLDPVSAQYNRIEPPAAWRTGEGWTRGEKPPRNYMNWWQWNIGQWVQYIDERRVGNLIAVVVASDASAVHKSFADAAYLCDGTNDEVQINAAIAAMSTAGGGVVFLSEGHFSIKARVLHKAGVSLIGSGALTILKVADDVATSFSIVDCEGATSCVIRNLLVDGNAGVISSSYGHVGIDLDNANEGLVADVTVQDVAFNPAGSGIGFRANTASQKMIRCRATGNEKSGFLLDSSSSHCIIDDCKSDANALYGFDDAGTRNTMRDCFAYDNTDDGFHCGGAQLKVRGGVSEGNHDDGVEITGTDCEVDGITSRDNDRHGIHANAALGGRICGNTVLANSQATDDTYSGIYLYGGAGGNLLVNGNRVKTKGSGNEQHAGVEIAASPNAPPGCVVWGNDLRGSCKTGGNEVLDPSDEGCSMPIYVWDGAAQQTDNEDALKKCNRV